MNLALAFGLSLVVGVGVGALYALLGARSPAPPLVALVGLLGIVLGEQGMVALKARWQAAQAPRAEASAAPSRHGGVL